MELAALIVIAGLIAAGVYMLLGALYDIERQIAHQTHETRRHIMALSDEVKAFAAEVSPQIDAAVAELEKIDAALNAAGDPDIPGAQAALAALREKFAALAAAVAVPEPGDVPPPVEG